MQPSTLILYNGGAYGTYLEWVLTTLVSSKDIVSPLTNTGSSHLFVGNFLGSPSLKSSKWSDMWHKKISQNNYFQFARAHLKTCKDDSIKENFNIALKSFDRIIFCYPDHKSVLLNVNNAFSKVWKDWFDNRLKDLVFAENLYSNWNIDPGTSSENIPIWIKREILSYNLIPSWQNEVEWFFPDTWSHPNCKFVFITDLLYDFKKIILEIQQFCHLDFRVGVDQLLEHHAKMLSVQQYLDQDEL